MSWQGPVALFILLLILLSFGGASASHGSSGGEQHRTASRAAGDAVRHRAVEDVIRRRSAGELSEEDARALLAEFLSGPRGGGGPAARPPRG